MSAGVEDQKMGRSDIASEKGVWKAFLKTLKITLDVETWEDFTGADKKKKPSGQNPGWRERSVRKYRMT